MGFVMNDLAIIGIAIFFLVIGKILYHTGEALAESDYPPSFPKVVNRTLYFLGVALNKIGFISYVFALVLAWVYILKELL
jgi:hypothetical protein